MRTLLTLLIVLILGISMSAQAAELYYEGFDYVAGSDINGQGVWSHLSGPASVVSDLGLTYPGLVVSGRALDRPATSVPRATLTGLADEVFTTSGTYYLTALLKTTEDVVGVIVRNQPPVYLVASKRGNGVAGLETNSGFETSDEGAFSTTDVNLIALRIVNQTGNDELNLVVNPDLSAGEPDWGSSLITFNHEITNSGQPMYLDLSSDGGT